MRIDTGSPLTLTASIFDPCAPENYSNIRDYMHHMHRDAPELQLLFHCAAIHGWAATEFLDADLNCPR